jgi:hypothetical protein
VDQANPRETEDAQLKTVTTQRRIEKTLARAEREFMGLVRGMSSWDDEATPYVRSLLTDFAACLDPIWSQNLGKYALRYLAEHER